MEKRFLTFKASGPGITHDFLRASIDKEKKEQRNQVEFTPIPPNTTIIPPQDENTLKTSTAHHLVPGGLVTVKKAKVGQHLRLLEPAYKARLGRLNQTRSCFRTFTKHLKKNQDNALDTVAGKDTFACTRCQGPSKSVMCKKCWATVKMYMSPNKLPGAPEHVVPEIEQRKEKLAEYEARKSAEEKKEIEGWNRSNNRLMEQIHDRDARSVGSFDDLSLDEIQREGRSPSREVQKRRPMSAAPRSRAQPPQPSQSLHADSDMSSIASTDTYDRLFETKRFHMTRDQMPFAGKSKRPQSAVLRRRPSTPNSSSHTPMRPPRPSSAMPSRGTPEHEGKNNRPKSAGPTAQVTDHNKGLRSGGSDIADVQPVEVFIDVDVESGAHEGWSHPSSKNGDLLQKILEHDSVGVATERSKVHNFNDRNIFGGGKKPLKKEPAAQPPLRESIAKRESSSSLRVSSTPIGQVTSKAPGTPVSTPSTNATGPVVPATPTGSAFPAAQSVINKAKKGETRDRWNFDAPPVLVYRPPPAMFEIEAKDLRKPGALTMNASSYMDKENHTTVSTDHSSALTSILKKADPRAGGLGRRKCSKKVRHSMGGSVRSLVGSALQNLQNKSTHRHEGLGDDDNETCVETTVTGVTGLTNATNMTGMTDMTNASKATSLTTAISVASTQSLHTDDMFCSTMQRDFCPRKRLYKMQLDKSRNITIDHVGVFNKNRILYGSVFRSDKGEGNFVSGPFPQTKYFEKGYA